MSPPAETPLWDEAVALYGRPGVAEACLFLQDRLGADVPLLLFAAWLGLRGRALGDEAERVEDEVAAWREEVVRPLRAIRRRLRSGPPPAPDAETEALRETIKRAELAAEKLELARLEALARSLPVAESGGAGLIRANLGAALRRRAPTPDAEALAALEVLAEAAAARAREGAA